MRYIREYKIEKVFVEGGKIQSFALPADAVKVQGIFILPQLPLQLAIPNNGSFLLGTLSVLLNNKNENSLHNFPLYAFPDATGKFSLGNDYAFAKKLIHLSTEVQPGKLVSFIYKDSGYMLKYLSEQPVLYADFDFDIHINLIYDDAKGDWSNNTAPQNVRVIHN